MNGKGSKRRKKIVTQEIWEENWTRIFKMGKKMSQGSKVLINTKDGNNHDVCDYGYIVRRMNAQLYEIWSETYQVSMLLSPEEFTEI